MIVYPFLKQTGMDIRLSNTLATGTYYLGTQEFKQSPYRNTLATDDKNWVLAPHKKQEVRNYKNTRPPHNTW